MLRGVPPLEACGGTHKFSPLDSTAAFDITNQFGCQDFSNPSVSGGFGDLAGVLEKLYSATS